MRRGGGACVTGAAGAGSSLALVEPEGTVGAGAGGVADGADAAGPVAAGGSLPGAGAAEGEGGVADSGSGAFGAPVWADEPVGAAGEDCWTDPWACSVALTARHAAPIHQRRMSDPALPATARLFAGKPG